jgi:hypothetical protein
VPERDHLDGLAKFVAVFETPGFSFGQWSESRETRPGVREMPYYIFSQGAEDFRAAVGRTGWVKPFDWGAWLQTPEGKSLKEDRDAVARADVPQLGKLLTAIIRSERFSEGSFAGAFESGLLTAICRRCAFLRDEATANDKGRGF